MNKEIREEFWKSFEKSPFIMIRREDGGGHAEPMTAQLDRDAHHAIWFFTSRTMSSGESVGHGVVERSAIMGSFSHIGRSSPDFREKLTSAPA